LEKSENKNTSRKTQIDIALFKAFLSWKNDNELEEFTPQELDAQYKEFILGVRKQDVTDYEPSSIIYKFYIYS
jgi:hypothetical protein